MKERDAGSARSPKVKITGQSAISPQHVRKLPMIANNNQR
jgi:hypothetical protein